MRCVVANFGLIVALSIVGVVGCGKSGPPMYQVSGKVLYKDGSVPHAALTLVNFVPTKESKAEIRRPATGVIGKDGSFTMFTRVNGDGVHPGEYAVLFCVASNPMNPVSLIPPQYSNPNSPPYKLVVDHDIDNLDYTIEPLPGAAGK